MFKNIRAEFKKVIWPSKADALKESVAVVIVSIAVGLIIALIDTLVKTGLGVIIK